MARDLDLGVRVIGSKTVRERDGLAMSSRNVYLTAEQRQVAPELFRAMRQAATRLGAGGDLQAALDGGVETIRRAGFALDYFEVRDSDTLAPIRSVGGGKLRILAAGRLGNTRLIDNIAVWAITAAKAQRWRDRESLHSSIRANQGRAVPDARVPASQPRCRRSLCQGRAVRSHR